MINTIRIRALDFIGSEYEDHVWERIQNAKKTCHNEFKILFYVDDVSDMTKVANAVSKNTDYLLAGKKAGSKLNKAETLNINILSEASFFDLIDSLN